MKRTSIEQDSLEANPNVVSTDLDTTNISPSSSEPPSSFTTYFEDMFQQHPKPVRFEMGGERQTKGKDNQPPKSRMKQPPMTSRAISTDVTFLIESVEIWVYGSTFKAGILPHGHSHST
jgi:hypothetical protein